MKRARPLDSEAYFGRRDNRGLLIIVVVAMTIPQIAGWLALRPLTVDWLNGSVAPDSQADYGRDNNVAQLAPLGPDIIPAAQTDRAFLAGGTSSGAVPPNLGAVLPLPSPSQTSLVSPRPRVHKRLPPLLPYVPSRHRNLSQQLRCLQ